MNSVLRRIGSAMSPVALLVALLALVVSAAGVGYAAGQIGSSQIKNNAITAKKIKKNAVTTKKIKKNAVTGDKVKDGTLTAADLPPNEVEKAATITNGGEGDCVWTAGPTIIPGLQPVTFRKDRFGTVHLAGLVQGGNGPGGDATCNSGDAGQSADAIVFMLPAGYVPAKTVIFGGVGAGGVIVVGAQGLVEGSLVLPPGAVASGAVDPALFDGISFEPVGSGVSLPKMTASGRVSGGLLKKLMG
jgi:hypothetical protein